VARFIKRALEGRELQIYGDGSQTRDFIYIGDLVKAIRASVSTGNFGGEIFQIATSHETTVAEMLDMLLACLADRGVRNIRTVYAGKRQGDVMRNYADTSKARRLLGWQAENDLAAGLAKTVDWFIRETG